MKIGVANRFLSWYALQSRMIVVNVSFVLTVSMKHIPELPRLARQQQVTGSQNTE